MAEHFSQTNQPGPVTEETVSESTLEPQAKGVPGNRLHPCTLFVPAAEAIVGMIIPCVIASIFANPLFVVPGFLFFGVLPVIAYNVVRYFTLSYEVGSEELVIHSGLLFRRERRIPFDRVQETEIVQGLPHRLFSVARLKISTAGSETAEATLNVIRVHEAERIKAIHAHTNTLSRAQTVAIAEQHLDEPDLAVERLGSELPESGLSDLAGAAVSQNLVASTDVDSVESNSPMSDGDAGLGSNEDNKHVSSQLTYRITSSELLLGGITSNIVATIGGIVGAIVYFRLFLGFGNWVEGYGKRIEAQIEETVAYPTEFVERFQAQLPDIWLVRFVFDILQADTLGKSVILATGGLVVAIVTYIVRYFDFQLLRSDDLLQSKYGLLTVRRSSLPLRRIQALKLEEGLLRRLFGLASIRVDSASDRSEIDESKKKDVLLPVAQQATAERVARETMPGLETITPEWKRVSRLAVIRGSRKGWLLTLVAIVQLYFAVKWYCLAGLPAFPIIYYLNLKWYENIGYSLSEVHFLSRKGWLNRSTLCIPIKNVQCVRVTQNFFDRRLGLATLSVDTAGQSNTGGGPRIRHMLVEEAKQIQQKLSAQVSETEFGI